MRRLAIFILVLYFCNLSIISTAQQTLQIGFDTYTTGRFSEETPFRTSVEDHKIQYLFLNNELSTLDNSLPITEIAFQVESIGALGFSNFKVKIGHTDISSFYSFTSDFCHNLETVYCGSFQPTQNTWNNIKFSRPFFYDGQSNIVVQICFDNSARSLNTNVFYSYKNNTVLYTSSNNEVGCNLSAGNDYDLLSSSIRPNIRFITSQTNRFGNIVSNPDESSFRFSQKNGHTQYIFKKEKLEHINCSGTDLNAIGFEIENHTNQDHSITIKIKNTISNSLSGFQPLSGFTTVYDGSYNFGTTGWNYFKFINPFYWDGVSNIIMDICFSKSTINSDVLLKGDVSNSKSTWSDFSEDNNGCNLSTGSGHYFSPNTNFLSGKLKNVKQNNSTIDKYQKFELTLDLSSLYGNYYNDNEIEIYAVFRSPSHELFKVPAFYYEGFSKSVNSNTPSIDYQGITIPTEELTKNSESWKIRFAPQETGKWTYSIIIKSNSGFHSFSTLGSFDCILDQSNKGFVKVKDQRYFEYSNGDIYLQNGLNYPSPAISYWRSPITTGSNYYEKMFEVFERNNINFVRIFADMNGGISLYGYDFEDSKMYFDSEYNLKDAWRLDIIIELAEQKEIKVQICMFNFLNLSDGAPAWGLWSGLAYGIGQSGTMEEYDYYSDYGLVNPFNDKYSNLDVNSPHDFFNLNKIESIRIQKNIIRYFISRWGYSTAVFSWELFNEANQFLKPSSNKMYTGDEINQFFYQDLISKWHSEMVSYIKQIDVHEHPITTSTTGDVQLSNVLNLIDFLSVHAYRTAYLDPQYYTIDRKIRNYYNNYLTQYVAYKKPYQIGEDGDHDLYGERMKVSNPDENIWPDRHFFDLHNLIWSSLFTGHSGNGAFWFRSSLEDNDINNLQTDGNFHIYKALGNFYRNINDLNDNYDFDVSQENSLESYRMFSLSNSDYVYGWVQDKDFRTEELINNDRNDPRNNQYMYNLIGRPIVEKEKFSVTNNSLKKGGYKVEWFDTETGLTLPETTNVYCDGTNLTLSMPDHMVNTAKYGDIAFKASFDCDINVWVDYRPLNSVNLNVNGPLTMTPFNQIFYLTNDNKIKALYRNGNQWGLSNLNNPVNDASGDIEYSPQGIIFYKTQDNGLKAIHYENGAWSQLILNGVTNLNNVNGDIVINNGGQVFYKTINNQIHCIYFSNGQWNWSNLNSASGYNVAGDLAVAENGTIFFRTTNNEINAIYYYNGQWNWSGLNGATISQDVAGSLVATSNSTVYYKNNNNGVGGIYFNGSLQDWLPVNFNGFSVNNVAGDLVSKNSEAVFYRTNNSNINMMELSNGTWTVRDLNQVTGGDVDNSMVLSDGGSIFYKTKDDHIDKLFYGSICDPELHNQRIKYQDPFIEANIVESSFDDFFNNENKESIEKWFNRSSNLSEANEIELNIIPNPNKGQFNIYGIPKFGFKSKIQIYSSYGSLVKEGYYEEGDILNLKNVDVGIYFIKVVLDEQSYFLKCIVQ